MRFLYSHLKDIPNQFDRAWLALSISLPLRPEEVLGLRWMDIDGRIVHVRATVTHPTRNQPEFKEYTKTESSRRDLVIPEEMLNYLPERGLPTDFVIGGSSALTYAGLRWIRKRIEKHTGFTEQILPRRFRTTVATDISAQTHDLKLVQRMLGHSTPQMTLKHYDKGRQTATDASEAIGKCYGFLDDWLNFWLKIISKGLWHKDFIRLGLTKVLTKASLLKRTRSCRDALFGQKMSQNSSFIRKKPSFPTTLTKADTQIRTGDLILTKH